MSRRVILTVSLVLTLALSLVTQGYTAVNAQASLVIDLDSSISGIQTDLQANLGDGVDVAIIAQDVTNLDSFDIELEYNPFKLKLDPGSIAPGDFLPVGTADFLMKDTSKPGKISISYSLPGQDPEEAPDGTGVIATMRFTLIGGGEIPIRFDKAVLFDSNRERDDVTNNSPESIVTGPDPNAQALIVIVNTTTAALGDIITVQVEIRNAVNLDSYDFKVTYNPFKLKLVGGSVVEGDFLRTTVDGESFFQADTSKPGEVWLSNSLPGQDPEEAPDGDGVLATMQFKVIGGGDISIDIVSPALFDSERNRFTPSVTPATLNVPRPTPAIAVDLNPSASGIQDALTVSPGSTFDVEIAAIDVTNLDSYNFKLNYDPQYLEVVQDSITEGSFLVTSADGETFLQVDLSTPGVISLSNSLPGQDPEQAPDGTGPIVGIQFKALKSGQVLLTCSDVKFFDSERITTDVTDIRSAHIKINTPPVADSQAVETDEDTPVDITLTGSDVDGDTLTFIIVSQPTNGNLSGTAPNLTYTPNLNFHGSDSFTFKVNDGLVDSTEATVSITVNSVNDTPIADSQAVETDEDTPVDITLTGSDVDGDTLTFIIVSQPTNGNLSGTAPNLTYTPNLNFHGSDSFTFKVNDGLVDSTEATVSITVNSVNDTPIADSQAVETDEDTPVDITLTGSDVDGDTLTFIIVSQPTNGNLSGTAPNLTYTPNLNFHGSDSFTFKVNDGLVDSTEATVSITVNPVNDPPVAVLGEYTIYEGESAVLDAGSSYDPDGTIVSYEWDLDNDGQYDDATGVTTSVSYPDDGQFTVGLKVTDDDGDYSTASAVVTVNNKPPVLGTLGPFSGDEGQPITLTATATDVPADTLSYAWDLDGDGEYDDATGATVEYTFPDNGTYTVGVLVTDDDGGSASGTATVDVSNLPPTADAHGPYDGIAGEPIELQGSGSDVPADTLTYEWDFNYDGITFDVDSTEQNPTVTYEREGTYTVALRVKDDDGGVSELSLSTVTVSPPPNRAPELVEIADQTINEGETLSFIVTAVDPDGDPVTLSAAGLPEGAEFDPVTGQFTFTPNFEQAGEYDVTFTATDNRTPPLSGEMTVHITVVNVENAIVLSVTPTLLKADGTSTAEVIATLISNGQPTPNAQVELTVTEGMGSLAQTSGTTDENGRFSTLYIAGMTSGDVWITATAPEYNVSDAVTLRLDGDGPTIAQVTGDAQGTTGEVIEIALTAQDPTEPISADIYLDGTAQTMGKVGPDEFRYQIQIPLTSVDPISYYIIASDGLGNTTRTPEAGSYTITVVDNDPPTANAGPDQRVELGQDVAFDGRGSTDNIGIVSYKWDIDASDGVDFESPDLTGPNPTLSGGYSAFGTYTVTLQVEDAAGNTDTDTLIVTVPDTIPPYILLDPITSPTGQTSITVTGTVYDREGGQPESGDTVNVMLNGIVRGTGTSGDDGTFSIEITDLADGLYQVTATATDSSGNTSDPTPPTELIVDTTPPSIAGLTPPDGGTVITRRPVISATLTDDLSGIVPHSITMTLAVGGQTFALNPTFDPNTGLLSYTPDSDLVNRAQYTVSVEVGDGVGNTGTASWSFTVNVYAQDTEPPTFSQFAPADGSTIPDPQPAISAIVTDPSGIKKGSVSVELADSEGNSVPLAGINFDESTGRISTTPASPLTDGAYTVTLSAQDNNDNEGTSSFGFTVDSTPPQPPTLEQPNTPTNQPALTLTGTAEPGSIVKIYLNGDPIATVNADSNTGAFSTDLTLAEGMNDITATATDSVGNTSELSQPVEVLLDTVSPVITALEPSTVTGSLTPTLTATLSDPTSSRVSGVDPESIELILDGQPVTGFSYDPSTGILTYQAGPFDDRSQHEFEVRCSDRAGNQATPVSATFLVNTAILDTTPPTIRFSVNEGDVLTENRPTFSVVFSDPQSDVDPNSISVMLDGTTVEYQFDETTDTATFTPVSPLADGEHAISASVSDNNGNKAEDAVNFAVKTKAVKPVLDPLPQFVSESAIALSGVAEPGSLVKIFVNDIPAGTAVADDTGRFSKGNVPLTPGVNAITAEAQDSYGNVSDRSDPVQVGYDIASPTAGNFSPVDGAVLNGIGSIGATISDDLSGVAPDSIVMSLDRVQVEATFADGTVSYTPAVLDEGEHLIILYAEDKVGNPMLVSWSFIIDTTSPQISAMAPGDGSVISNATPTLSAALTDNYGIDRSSLRLLLNGQEITDFNYDPASGEISYQIGQPLQDGESYTFEVTAADVAGNISTASSTFTVDTSYTDEVPPDFANQSPAPGSSINLTLLQMILIVILDGDSGVDWSNVTVFINGVQIPIEQLGWSSMRNAVSLNRRSGTLLINVKQLQEQNQNPIQIGENTVKVVAADKAGNQDETQWSFYVVTEAPDKPVLDPITSPTNQKNVDVTGTVPNATPDNPLSVTVLVDGVEAGSADVNDDGSFTVQDVILSKGENTITAYAVDKAGNQSELSDPVRVTLDQTPPKVNFIIAEYTNKPQAMLVGWSDEELSELTVILNGERNALTPALSFRWTATLAEGKNTVQIEAIDLAGNKATTDPQIVYLDVQPPTAQPTDLRARVSLDGRSVLLSWSGTDEAAKYNIYRSDSPITSVSDDLLIAQNIDKTEYRDPTVQIDKTYFYAVTPIDAAGNEGKEALSDNVAARIFRSPDAAAIDYPDLASVQLSEGSIPGGTPSFKVSLSIAPLAISSIPDLGTVPIAFDFSVYGQDGLPVEALGGDATVIVPIPTTVDLKRFMPTLYLRVNDEWVAVEDQTVDEATMTLTARTSRLGTLALVLIQTARPFTLSLSAGLNLFSVPVSDPNITTVADLMNAMGDAARFILRYNVERGKFDVLLPGDPKAAQTPISGNEGYLTSLKEPVTLDLEGYAWDGTVSIHKGVNLIAMPVKPAEPMKLSDFMSYFGDAITTLLWFDSSENKFKALIPQTAAESKWNVDVRGGAGYLVIAKSDATYTFEGETWSTEEGAAAPAIVLSSSESSPLVVIEGDLAGMTEGVNVRVENVTRGISETAEVENGGFAVALMKLGIEHEIGDLIKVTVDAPIGYCAEPVLHRITPEEIAAGLVRIEIQLRPTPKRTALLPNYPNPFNPETWIPFQLAEDADVVIRIYDMTGKLVRTLNMGYLRAGYYTSRSSAAYWDGRNEMGEKVASGIYVYQMVVGGREFVRRMVILK